MPPAKKDKKKHQRSNRGVASFDAVKARNRAESEEAVEKKEDESSSSEEEEEEVNDPNVFKKEKGATLANIIDRQALNAGGLNNDDQFAEGPSRKQREEIEKEKKRRAYLYLTTFASDLVLSLDRLVCCLPLYNTAFLSAVFSNHLP